MTIQVENIGDFLKSNNIKPSYQRIKIYEYLVGTTAHPTVDTIYRALLPSIPTLSKTTVYNTLNLFVENDIALLITIEENETRYDADTSVHGHFKCDMCGHVLDFRTDLSALQITQLEGCAVTEQHIYFRGTCSACLEKNS
jgi:Fe2+ or Zn2+ uptake regulation protein